MTAGSIGAPWLRSLSRVHMYIHFVCGVDRRMYNAHVVRNPHPNRHIIYNIVFTIATVYIYIHKYAAGCIILLCTLQSFGNTNYTTGFRFVFGSLRVFQPIRRGAAAYYIDIQLYNKYIILAITLYIVIETYIILCWRQPGKRHVFVINIPSL